MLAVQNSSTSNNKKKTGIASPARRGSRSGDRCGRGQATFHPTAFGNPTTTTTKTTTTTTTHLHVSNNGDDECHPEEKVALLVC